MQGFNKLVEKLKSKQTWDTAHLVNMLGEWKNEVSMRNYHFGTNVKEIRVGDIVDFDIAGQLHPAIIIRIVGDICYACVLTSKENDYCTLGAIENSRLFEGSYYTCTIGSMTKERALARFVGVFDNPHQLKQIKQKLHSLYQTVLK